ncbi:MAG: hypothetical protein K1X87_11425, partial [Dehalococcoidia bacterium]|nr:hypothetical protein [Dehalococcoidia bacterium]
MESRGSEPADGLATTFPEALRSLQNFRMSYWRDGNGELVAAPWAAPEFPARLADAAAVALRRMDFTSLVIFGRCAHERMIDSLPTPEDLHALLALRAKPDRFVPDGGDMRVQAILEAVGDGERCATLRHQVMVLLVALGAAPERAVPPTSIEPMMEAVGLADTPVGAFLAAALRLGLEADNPLGRLRAELRRTPKRTSAELEQDLLAAEDELRSTFKHLYSAAGGKVQRTHCRGAWDEFLLKARPVIDGVLAATHDDIREIDGLIVLHDKIADRAGAKYLDRGVMNRAARQLVDVTRKVVAARREQARQQREQPMSAVANLIAAYRALDGAAGFGAAFVPLLHDLVVAPADAPEASVRSMLEKSDFLRIPALLETVPVVATDTVPIAVDPWTLADPVSAAVHLLLVDRSDFASPPDQDILALLRERKREDLLVHVTPVSKADAARAQQALKQARMDQYQALSAAEKQVRRMREVAHPWAPAVAEAVQEALKVAETTGVDGVKPEMLTTWMLRVTNYANDAVAQSIERMSEQFARQSPSPTEERQEHFQRAIQCGRLAAARALANGENLPNDESERATMWRREAVQTLVDPRRTLSRHTGEPALLIQAWLTGLRDEARDVELRRLFAGFVFAGELTPVENEKHRAVSIKNTRLREWLADAHLNPAFVPQLTAFKEIAVITAPVPPTVDSFVRQTAEAVAHAGDKRITVVLTPGITRQVRDALREDLRRRSARGYAILDDIDFARLVNPGGQQPNAVLGLLEIVLEQQPRWSPVQPFEPHEGQHTKPEMFVGREDEASRLATRAQYSRLFSGRKLGKSALLKHIRDTQQNTKLPSGNKLRVLYVPVVGLDGEAQVVDKIARCFAEELKHTPPSPPSDPQERLKHLVATYFERKQNDSVLVFLDEADMFVEAQIRDYEVRRERCLTWLMRTDLEARRDAMDLPRIRFVFAGYRATHRNEAAWANWGDVLR